MSEASHTPGPWKRLPIQGECKISHADFLLMRAAPELLKALTDIFEILNLDDANSYVSDDREGAIETAFGTARDAIAKATA